MNVYDKLHHKVSMKVRKIDHYYHLHLPEIIDCENNVQSIELFQCNVVQRRACKKSLVNYFKTTIDTSMVEI